MLLTSNDVPGATAEPTPAEASSGVGPATSSVNASVAGSGVDGRVRGAGNTRPARVNHARTVVVAESAGACCAEADATGVDGARSADPDRPAVQPDAATSVTHSSSAADRRIDLPSRS